MAEVHQKILAVMRDVGGIAKGERNQQQGYSYRGIDQVYNELHELLAKHGLFTIPFVVDSKREERPTASGGVLAFTTALIDYHFMAEDGSHETARVIGQGMDSGDKDANKAMAVAHKYALLQVFAIPTEEAKDPEVDSPTPAAPQEPLQAPKAVENAPESAEASPDGTLLDSVYAKGVELAGELSEKAQVVFTGKLDEAKAAGNADQLSALVQAMTTQVANRKKREAKDN